MPKLKLITDGDLRKVFSKRFNSDAWWILVIPPSNLSPATAVLREIEESHYWDEANIDFDMVIDPFGLSFIFAKKNRMSPDELAQILNRTAPKNGQFSANTLQEQNCIPITLKPQLLRVQLYNWLTGSKQN